MIVNQAGNIWPVKLFLLFAFCNLILGLIIGIINYFFFGLELFSLISALCIASFIPIWCMGFIAEQLKKIYNVKRSR